MTSEDQSVTNEPRPPSGLPRTPPTAPASERDQATESEASLPAAPDPEHGWRSDPTGRHQARYFVNGQPTDLVADGGVESIDALAAFVPSSSPESAGPELAVDEASARPKRLRPRWILLAIAAVLLIAGVVVAMALTGGDSTEEDYLDALGAAELRDEFAADRAAVANAEAVCEQLDGGAPAQGSEADKIGVEYYCDDYFEAFQILEDDVVQGEFVIVDEEGHTGRFGGAGAGCQGDSGYGDLNSSTQVVTTNGDGDELARTELGPGTVDALGGCEFRFELNLTEGEEAYIVAVGDRGEFSYSWDEITAPNAVSLSIG